MLDLSERQRANEEIHTLDAILTEKLCVYEEVMAELAPGTKSGTGTIP